MKDFKMNTEKTHFFFVIWVDHFCAQTVSTVPPYTRMYNLHNLIPSSTIMYLDIL